MKIWRLLSTKGGLELPDVLLIDFSLRGVSMKRLDLQLGTFLFAFETIVGSIELGTQDPDFKTL